MKTNFGRGLVSLPILFVKRKPPAVLVVPKSFSFA
jgi:hypothetical protein